MTRLSATDGRNLTLATLAVLAAACPPWLAGNYQLTIGVTIAMYAVLATSWALFSGPTHCILLATAACFGVEAYVTGAVLAPRYVSIEPALTVTPMLSFEVVIMALLGATGRMWGPLVGVIPFAFLWEAISVSLPNQTTLLLGVAFLLIVSFLPRGFVGLIEDIRKRMGAEGGRRVWFCPCVA